jgi:WD40 repeat protein
MWRITIRLRPIPEHRRLGTEEWQVMGCSKLPTFDLRLPGAIAVVLITLVTLSNPEPVQDFAHPRIARGECGVQATSFALSPTSGQIATTNTAGRVTLRAPETGWEIERFLDFPGYAKAVAFSPDGRSLAVGGFARGICLWDLPSPKSEATQTILVPIQRAKCMMFSPDGRSLAVTTDLDGTILVWDLAARRERMVLHHPSPVVSLAFSPDGRWLATGGARDDWSILLWDLQTGSRQVLLEDGPGPAVALAFSPDGTLLATAGFQEHDARLWDLKTRRVCRMLAGHARPINSVSFSPDGSLLATADNDGMLGLWTVATGQRRMSLDSHATRLLTVAFSPDGRTLVLSTGEDDDIRLWDIAKVLRAPLMPPDEQRSGFGVVIVSE